MQEFDELIEAVKKGALEDVRAILTRRPELIHLRDQTGATPLHYAALAAHRGVVEFLVQQGADINLRDGEFGATPTGWAIEYLRELGGFLGIELDDFSFAIRRGDVEWCTRLLKRFPALRNAADSNGASFESVATQTGNPEIVRIFQSKNGP
jgi:ankyrin repeat protein